LERALVRSTSAATNPHGLATFRASPPKPDLPFTAVLLRVYKILGGAPEGASQKEEFIRKVNRQIMDKVVHERMHVWGRLGERALEPLTDGDCWERGTLDHKRQEFRLQAAYSNEIKFTDLHFSKAEVERVWPIPPRTTNDGRS
jgi:hypothetical protein